MYNDLMQLARERSSERRVELLRQMTDMYFNGVGDHTSAEVFLFNEIVSKIVDTVARDGKIQIAANLATLPNFPRDIVHKLAEDDDIEIARPVLRGAAALTDDDLVTIASRASQAHLHAMAQRATLSERLTDVLVDRGDRKVVHTVSANHGAEFSADGMQQLLTKAEEDVDLRELLVERPDLSQETVDKLLPLVSEQLAIRLSERGFDVQSVISAEMMQQVRQRVNSALRERKADIREVEHCIAEVRAGRLPLDRAVQQLAASDRLLDVAAIVGEFAQLDRSYTFSVLGQGQLQTQLILFRSLDLSWDTLNAVLSLRAKKLGMPYEPSLEIQRDYEAVDPALAARVLRFLKVRRVASQQASGAALPASTPLGEDQPASERLDFGGALGAR